MIGVPSITRFVKFIRLGEAAVRYYLTSSAKSIAVDADGNAVSPDETISIRVMKQVGSSSPVKNYDCSFICYTVKDGVETNFGPSKFSGSFSFSAEMINGEDAIRAKLFSTAGDVIDTLDIIASKKGDKGDRGAVLRGPQAWADIANGYVFQAGGDNDEWKDVVLYNSNYYSCLKGHTKTASNYPTSTEDTNNGYWKLGDKIELVATKILLATYALVKNLGVEAIDMKDSSGDVIFQAKDGKVICNSGTFENVTIAGYMYKKKTIITKNNVSEYITTDIFSDPCLDILKSGTWLEFSDLSQNLFILMPSIYPDITTYTEEQKRVVRSMIGNTILLQNTSSKIVGITGRLKSAENKSGESVGINQNEFISLECKATVTNDYEDIYWLYRKGKIR